MLSCQRLGELDQNLSAFGLTARRCGDHGGERSQSKPCYPFNMKSKPRRAGATEALSVSVDAGTKRALRQLADAEFGVAPSDGFATISLRTIAGI